MQFVKKYGFLILTIIITLIGFLTLKYSVNLGTNAASTYLSSMGGSMDSANFNAIQITYIIANITIGGIVMLVGFAFFCFSIYKLLKEDCGTS